MTKMPNERSGGIKPCYKRTMKYGSLILIVFSLLSVPTVTAQQGTLRVAKRSQLLKELKKCVSPRQASGCDEMSVARVAELYKRGDTAVLRNLMDVAPHSDGALSESLGEFFSELLCHKPETFLRAVATRPRSEQDHLLFLAATADGSGMGCKNMSSLRQRLKAISQKQNNRLANLARRCLAQVNKYNPAR